MQIKYNMRNLIITFNRFFFLGNVGYKAHALDQRVITLHKKNTVGTGGFPALSQFLVDCPLTEVHTLKKILIQLYGENPMF